MQVAVLLCLYHTSENMKKRFGPLVKAVALPLVETKRFVDRVVERQVPWVRAPEEVDWLRRPHVLFDKGDKQG
jgi:hypothetical protein